ncbi:ferredoxin [Streptomyces sp. NPDC050164]|uniref:ferredoxin n=1 Tax=Streptomyces sp. NPDC050164 TaxID=3365605 RepID=UPI003789215F
MCSAGPGRAERWIMRVQVFRDRCCGSGNCAATAPEVFGQDSNEGRVVLRSEEVSRLQAESVRRAVDECPTAAIELAQ